MSCHIDVIATTISGSIKDWGKVKRIVPLFHEHGEMDVNLCVVDSHAEARVRTAELIRSGGKTVISAGGSGTFNAVLEGCYDAGVHLGDIRLGFLRKGSADLIGKLLGMPDEVEKAVGVFVNSIRRNVVVPCDVIKASSKKGDSPPRRFVGYGGAEIFGRIPHFTENRFIKYYKGVLGQLFGDLGPFFIGTTLAVADKLLKRVLGRRRRWRVTVDDHVVAESLFQALIIVNGDLGPDLPFARSQPLGSGRFHLFTIKDIGAFRLFGQLKHAWDASIMDNPGRWAFDSFTVRRTLVLQPDDDNIFPVNVDGSTLKCRESAEFEICDRINLLAG